MALLIFSLEEVIEIAKANYKLPNQISEIKANGDEVLIKVDTGMPLLNANVTLKYDHYENNIIHCKLKTNKFIQPFLNLISSIGNDQITLNHEKISVNINEIISEHIKGVRIKDIAYIDSRFEININ